MPLSTDEQVVQTSKGIVATLQAIAGPHPGFRPVHARGALFSGTFTPTPTAASLSSAQHLNSPSTPITVRFSSSTGIPDIPDTDPQANPRGFAIRFHLGGRKHTDVIAHSTPFFPTRTGEDFLAFLRAAGASQGAAEHPTPVEQFLAQHPETLAFLGAPKPSPASFAREKFWGVTALKFVKEGAADTYFRYQVEPVAGVETLDEAALKDKPADYLFAELPKRVEAGPVEFKLMAQLAEEGDVVDNATVHWPESRKVVELGIIKVEALVDEAEQAPEQKKIIFDPIPRVEGIEPSGDPLLDVRASVYLISGRERRVA